MGEGGANVPCSEARAGLFRAKVARIYAIVTLEAGRRASNSNFGAYRDAWHLRAHRGVDTSRFDGAEVALARSTHSTAAYHDKPLRV